MNVAICDDELQCIDEVNTAVNRWTSEHKYSDITVYRFLSTEDLLSVIRSGLLFDLIFLDIQIPDEMSGLELAKLLRKTNPVMGIVFITGYSEYACDGYSVNALRYILYIAVQDHHIEIYETGERPNVRMRMRIADIVKLLPADVFVQCNRSFVVNLMYVRMLRKGELMLADGTNLPVGIKYVNQVNAAFSNFYRGVKM